ncbi:MAG: nucleoside deaminase [Acidobacteriota bacterium]
MDKKEKEFLNIAINEAEKGMNDNDGGPFGAVIVKDGNIIAAAHNEVISSNDPTAHAEIIAIRKASKKLGRFDLSDCEIYSTCEPCPMCFAAIHWAKIKTLYFGCDNRDAAKIGFDDKFIYDVIRGNSVEKQVKTIQSGRDECLTLFKSWENKKDKVQY